MRLKHFILLFISVIFLKGCAVKYGDRCLEELQEIIQKNTLFPYIFQTKDHKIFALFGPEENTPQKNKRVHVYIEGDGLSWASRTRISLDPTPVTPTALRMAMADQIPSTKIYLARPGQYIQDPQLSFYAWTFSRFSQEIITSYVTIIDQIQVLYPGARFTLFGYSGGAMIALLVAAQRYQAGQRNIQKVITFAGVLDHEAWSNHHQSTPLYFSLNTGSYVNELKNIPQVHYMGERDQVVPASLGHSYQDQFSVDSGIQLITVPKIGHEKGWEDFWRRTSMP